MIVTWTTVRAPRPTSTPPWQPDGADWWQAGPTGAGRPEPPAPNGRWWAVLASWPTLAAASRETSADDGLDVWHVVLEAASFRGDAGLADGARPFAGVPASGGVEGAAAVVTFALPSTESLREREFYRRFLHAGRSAEQAPGLLAALAQAPAAGAVLTFSAWADLGAALQWAYGQQPHAATVERQRAHRLVDASGFLRCAVLSSRGTLGDRPDPLAGRTGTVDRG